MNWLWLPSTFAVEYESMIIPKLSPTRPPVPLYPVTFPIEYESIRFPLEVPTSPPILFFPLTFPLK